jgi:hypothetical protein
MCFAYQGWSLKKFHDKVKPRAADLSSLPVCLAVHKQNYLAIRPTKAGTPILVIIDFSMSRKPGMAAAFFLNIYSNILTAFGHGMADSAVLDGDLMSWFLHTLTIVPPEGKWTLTSDGELRTVAHHA